MVKDKAWNRNCGRESEGSSCPSPVSFGQLQMPSALWATIQGKMQSSYIYPKKDFAIIPAPYPGQSLTLFEDWDVVGLRTQPSISRKDIISWLRLPSLASVCPCCRSQIPLCQCRELPTGPRATVNLCPETVIISTLCSQAHSKSSLDFLSPAWAHAAPAPAIPGCSIATSKEGFSSRSRRNCLA